MSDGLNPAAEAQPVEDVQGDARWMSQVGVFTISTLCSNAQSMLVLVGYYVSRGLCYSGLYP